MIHLDGKGISRSATIKEQLTRRSEGGKGAVHILHAWCSELQVCLGQYKTETKILEKETRYYISSLIGNASQFNQMVRSHWNIENQLHWSLYV